jgi:hypothetical protein
MRAARVFDALAVNVRVNPPKISHIEHKDAQRKSV